MKKRNEQIEKWIEENRKSLDSAGYELVPKSDNYKIILIFISFVVGVLFTGIFFYGIQSDAFKSDVNQSVVLRPNVTSITNNDIDSPVKVDNNYKFNPNHTIINNIFCPE